MYKTIKGRYEEGKLILEETPPVQYSDVLVIFQSNGCEETKITRKFGAGKGIVSYMTEDFNEPLEDLKDYM